MSDDPNMLVAELAAVGIGITLLWRYFAHVRKSPRTPDPWDAKTEQELSEAKEVCPHCLTEQPTTAWFCKGCGRAIGPYNNLMPYVQIFSEGEVFRNSTNRHFQKRPWILFGYFLIFGAMFPLLAPFYLVWLLTNWKRSNTGNTIPDSRQ